MLKAMSSNKKSKKKSTQIKKKIPFPIELQLEITKQLNYKDLVNLQKTNIMNDAVVNEILMKKLPKIGDYYKCSSRCTTLLTKTIRYKTAADYINDLKNDSRDPSKYDNKEFLSKLLNKMKFPTYNSDRVDDFCLKILKVDATQITFEKATVKKTVITKQNNMSGLGGTEIFTVDKIDPKPIKMYLVDFDEKSQVIKVSKTKNSKNGTVLTKFLFQKDFFYDMG